MRQQLILSDKSRARLERLKADTNAASFSEVVSRALEAYDDQVAEGVAPRRYTVADGDSVMVLSAAESIASDYPGLATDLRRLSGRLSRGKVAP